MAISPTFRHFLKYLCVKRTAQSLNLALQTAKINHIPAAKARKAGPTNE
jgi:hypothetical protein